MNKLQKLQDQLSKGKITKEQYRSQLAVLLADEEITREEYTEAKEFEAEGGEDELLYSQEDMNRAVLTKARTMLRKIAKDAGVDLTDVSNKDLTQHLTDQLKTGGKKGEGVEGDAKELETLRKRSEKFTELEKTNRTLAVKVAVLENIHEFNPHNPAQVVRALQANEYADMIEVDDETGDVNARSVATALKRLAKNESNLFQTVEGDEEGNNNPDDNAHQRKFSGKPPGGGGGNTNQNQQQTDKVLAQARELMGLPAKK